MNLELISLREPHVDAVRNIVETKKGLVVLPSGFGKSLIFQLLPFVFDSWMEVSDSIVLLASPLTSALMRDQLIKLQLIKTRPAEYCRETIVH